MLCRAFDRDHEPCRQKAASNSKWCPSHEELQGKCMRIYKKHSRELDGFCDGIQWPSLPATVRYPDADAINDQNEAGTLREWHNIARRAWTLTNRAVLAREHHHREFYQDGDESHRHFILVLSNKRVLWENIMASIDERVYKLFIAEEASWLEDDRIDSDRAEIACEEPTIRPEEPPTPPQSPVLRPTASCAEHNEDGLFHSPEDARRASLQQKLLNYLVVDKEAHSLQSTAEETIRHIFRRTISRDKGLLLRAREFSPSPSPSDPAATSLRAEAEAHVVRAFVTSDGLSTAELQRLWADLKFGQHKIGPALLRNAIADVYRHGHTQDCAPARTWVLGGWVYRKQCCRPLPQEGWDAFYAFIGCAGCMLLTCRTFAEWVNNRKLSLLGPRYPGWLEEREGTIEHTFRALGIALIQHNGSAKTSRLEKVVPKGKAKGMRTVFTETQERYFIHLRLKSDDSDAMQFLDALASLPSFYSVITRRATDTRVIHQPSDPKELWCTRLRSGYSPAERRSRPFTPSAIYSASVFNTLRAPGKGLDDAIDAFILDARGVAFKTFSQGLANAALKAAGYSSLDEALMKEGAKYAGQYQLAGEILVRYRAFFREPM